jgi:hypothetical protein
MLLAHTYTHTHTHTHTQTQNYEDTWSRIEDPQINPDRNSHLTFDKEARN